MGVAEERAHHRRENLGRLLFRSYRAINDRLISELNSTGFGLRLGHVGVISNLEYDGGTRLSTLASRAGVTKQAVTPVVRDLEQMGYVDTSTDPTDGRAKLVSLTPEGRRLIDAAQPLIVAIEGEIGRLLGKRLAELHETLRQLLESLEEGSPYP